MDFLEYLSNIFQLFYKYKKENLYKDILELLIEMTEKNKEAFNIVERCLNFIKKSSKEQFNKIMTDNKLRLKWLELTGNYYQLFDENKEILDKILIDKDLTPKFNIENLDIFSRINLGFGYQNIIEKNNSEQQDLKTNLFILVQKINEIIPQEEEKNNKNKKAFKYSIHPSLSKIFDNIGFDYKGKEFKFNSKIEYKSKIYKQLIKKKYITNINNILEYEGINLENIQNFNEIEYNNIIKILKLVMNIYDQEENNFYNSIIDLINGYLKSNDCIFTIITELLSYNLHNLKYVTLQNIKFLNKIANNITVNLNTFYLDENLLTLMSRVCKDKINILPFLSEETFKNLIENNTINENLINYYNEIESNVYCFQTDNLIKIFKIVNNNKSAKDKLKLTQFKYQFIEIFKNITQNNFINLHKIFSIANHNSYNLDPNNIFTLFILKLCNTLPNIASVIPTCCKKGIKDILKFINSLRIKEEDLKIIAFEITHLPAINYILESHSNILLLERNLNYILRDFVLFKLLMIEELIVTHPDYFNKAYIIQEKVKLLKIKNYVLQKTEDNDVKNIYEKLRNLYEFSAIQSIFTGTKNKKMKEEIERIYSS